MAVKACTLLSELGPLIRQAKIESEDLNMPWLRIIQGAGKCETARRAGTLKLTDNVTDLELPCNVVYSVLAAMSTFPSDNDDLVFEAISNALVRRVLFVTGAIDMSGCPPADRGEAVFIGRSNVGKSSLVNMVRFLDFLSLSAQSKFKSLTSFGRFRSTPDVLDYQSKIFGFYKQTSWKNSTIQLFCG